MRSMLNFSTTRARAAAPSACARAGSPASRMSARASAAESCGGTSNPDRSGSMTSGVGPTLDAIVGRPRPAAFASATPRPLEERREHEQVGEAHQPTGVVPTVQEAHVALHPDRADLGLELGAQPALADHEQEGAREGADDLGQGADQVALPLLRREAPDVEEQGVGVADGELGAQGVEGAGARVVGLLEVSAVDEAHPRGIASVSLRCGAHHGAGDRDRAAVEGPHRRAPEARVGPEPGPARVAVVQQLLLLAADVADGVDRRDARESGRGPADHVGLEEAGVDEVGAQVTHQAGDGRDGGGPGSMGPRDPQPMDGDALGADAVGEVRGLLEVADHALEAVAVQALGDDGGLMLGAAVAEPLDHMKDPTPQNRGTIATHGGLRNTRVL
jgi:hypothetical protein